MTWISLSIFGINKLFLVIISARGIRAWRLALTLATLPSTCCSTRSPDAGSTWRSKGFFSRIWSRVHSSLSQLSANDPISYLPTRSILVGVDGVLVPEADPEEEAPEEQDGFALVFAADRLFPMSPPRQKSVDFVRSTVTPPTAQMAAAKDRVIMRFWRMAEQHEGSYMKSLEIVALCEQFHAHMNPYSVLVDWCEHVFIKICQPQDFMHEACSSTPCSLQWPPNRAVVPESGSWQSSSNPWKSWQAECPCLGLASCFSIAFVANTDFQTVHLQHIPTYSGSHCIDLATRVWPLEVYRWFSLWHRDMIYIYIVYDIYIYSQRKLGSNTSELRTNRILRLEMMKGGMSSNNT